MLDNLKFYIPAFFFAGIILYLSAFPGPQIDLNFDFVGKDKIGHLIAYFTLSVSIAWGYFKTNLKLSKKASLIILVVGFFYGYSMESMQYLFFPNRYFDYGDLVANFIGSFLGIKAFQKIIVLI